MRKGVPPGAKPPERAAVRPDAAQALGDLTAFLRRCSGRMRGAMRAIFAGIGGRCEAKCTYGAETLCWALTGLFLMRNGSVNAADADRNCGSYARWLSAVAGAGPGGRAPCGELLRHWFGRADPALVAELLATAFEAVALRGKLVGAFRCGGALPLAIDGTDREKCRKGTCENGGGRRVALVASVLLPWGRLPVAFEEMDVYDWERDKADCELKALARLAARLKGRFPRLRLCLVGDALYACRAVFALCRRNGWHFVATFKEGRSPAVFAEAGELLRLSPGNAGEYRPTCQESHRRRKGRGTRRTVGSVAWAADVDFGDLGGESFRLTVVRCDEMSPMRYSGLFVTDLPCADDGAASHIATCGRRRWLIESQNQTQKHLGYGLGTAFVNKGAASKNFFLFMLLATFLWEIFYKLGLRHWQPDCGKVSQRKWVELVRALLVSCENDPWTTAGGPRNLKVS